MSKKILSGNLEGEKIQNNSHKKVYFDFRKSIQSRKLLIKDISFTPEFQI